MVGTSVWDPMSHIFFNLLFLGKMPLHVSLCFCDVYFVHKRLRRYPLILDLICLSELFGGFLRFIFLF